MARAGQHSTIQHIAQSWPQVIFRLWPKQKEFLSGRSFNNDEEVKDALKQWLNGRVAEAKYEDVQKLVTG
jgi:hypothetical protein